MKVFYKNILIIMFTIFFSFIIIYNYLNIVTSCKKKINIYSFFENKYLNIKKNIKFNLDNFKKVEVEPIKNEVESIKNEVESIKNEVESIKNEVESIKNEVEPIKNEVEPIKNEVEPIKNEVEPIKNEVEPIKNEVEPIKNEVIEKYKDKINFVYVSTVSKMYAPNIIEYILKYIPNLKIVEHNKANYIIYHIVEYDKKYNKHKINIVISGEPTYLNNKVDLVIGTTLKQNTLFNIYYPLLYGSLKEHKKSINNLDYNVKKTKFCAFMYKMHYEHRVKYFDLINNYYKKVDGLGKSRNNIKLNSTRDVYNENETYNDIAVEIYKDYKFVLAIENCKKQGYSTEKLINPLIANCIPIYWGDSNIFNYINKKRVIYIDDYTDIELLNVIKHIDNNEQEYNRIINEKWFVNENKLPNNIEMELELNIKNILETEIFK
jgi:uncharacterized protein YoxC